MTKLSTLAFAGAAGLAAATATAAAAADFDLQITEIWPGNEPGANLSADWFEITNLGDMAWTQGADGDLFFDDDSQDPLTADLISGIASIAPGESVIAIDADPADVADWLALWGFNTGDIQVGTYAGSGLSGGGDGVSLWIGATPVLGQSPDDYEEYPFADNNGGQSYDVVLGAFSTVGNASGAYATTTVNDEGQPAIGSPGTIPAPGSLALLGLSGLAATRRRR